MYMSPEQLIKRYYAQLHHGCCCIHCTNNRCASCPKFVNNYLSPTQAAIEAVKLALNHVNDPQLCHGVSPLLIHPEYKPVLIRLEHVFSKMIKNKFKEEGDDNVITDLKKCFENPDIFSFLILSNSFQFSIKNIALDKETVADMYRAIPNYLAIFSACENSYTTLIRKLTSEKYPDTFYHIRGLLIVWIFEVFLGYPTFQKRLYPLIEHIMSMKEATLFVYKEFLSQYPQIIKVATDLVLVSLNSFIRDNTIKQLSKKYSYIRKLGQFIQLLRDTNDESVLHIKSSYFYSNSYTRIHSAKEEIRKYIMHEGSILAYPAALAMTFKTQAFLYYNLSKMNVYFNQHMININNNPVNIINVRRDHLVHDTIEQVLRIKDNEIHKKLVVVFQGEKGQDEGGVSREFFYLLINQVFSPDYGMFELIKNKYYWFKKLPISEPIEIGMFQVLGTVLSLAIFNNVILPIRFPLLLYKKILQKKIELKDLAELEPEIVKSLTDLKDMVKNEQNVEDLCLTFSTTIEHFGNHFDIPLIPFGETENVTNSNVNEYIEAYLTWYAYTSIERQYDAFVEGFSRIIDDELFQIFTPDELDVLISGEEVFDWNALEENAMYDGGYTSDSRVVKWFWQLFNEMTNEQKAKFLRFSTGTDRAPCGGLAKVTIIIQKGTDPSKLPVSHTCFNIFQLPEYPNKETLKKRVLTALEHTEGFGLI